MSLADDFLHELLDALNHDRLTLPTLPEVALRIRESVDDPNVSAAQLAQVIGNDAALAARIIKVANSPLLRGRMAIDNLQSAITRLGITFVRNLATGLAMEQMFQATNDLVDKRLRDSWEHSIEVASISHVLASHYTRLKPDQATLAGLVHEIGMLPILACAEDVPELLASEDTFNSIIDQLHPQIGTAILKAWDFPPELIAVPMGYLDLGRISQPGPDYVDIVTVANLQSYAGTQHPLTQFDWAQVPAFGKLGLSPEIDVHTAEELADDIEQAKQLFS